MRSGCGPEPSYDSYVQAMLEAPFTEGGWTALLASTARASGGWGGQMLGIAPSGELFLDVASGIPAEALAAFEALGGVDPTINPRARIFAAPSMRVFGDDDFLSPELQRRNPFYHELYSRFDAPHAALAKIPTPLGGALVVAGVRSARQGQVSSAEAERLQHLLPYVAAAARLQLALEDQGHRIALGALESVRLPVFLLNHWGAVVCATSAGEDLLSAGNLLRIRKGRLEGMDRASTAALEADIRRARSGANNVARPLLLRDRSGAHRLAEVTGLPASISGIRLGAVCMLVLGRTPGERDVPAQVLTRVFGLTAAEAQIAAMLSRGQRVEEIAHERGVRPDTVRVQLKSIFAKTGASSQLQLSTMIRDLVGDF